MRDRVCGILCRGGNLERALDQLPGDQKLEDILSFSVMQLGCKTSLTSSSGSQAIISNLVVTDL